MRNRNAEVILALCSRLCAEEGVLPLEAGEWSRLEARLAENGWQPADLPALSREELTRRLPCGAAYAARLRRLLERGAGLTLALNRYRSMGITAVTRAEAGYPPALKRKLGSSCPPLLYCAGDLSLLAGRLVGYVGSRAAEEEDAAFARATVAKTAAAGYGVVSGGARGIDTVCAEAALALGAPVVEQVADSVVRRLRRGAAARAVGEGRLLILSAAGPDADFRTDTAMMRNRCIYAAAEAAVVVRADLGKGGTWAGATENLRRGWCRTLCWNKPGCQGNQALIAMGAIPIGGDWDGGLEALLAAAEAEEPRQQSLFDL